MFGAMNDCTLRSVNSFDLLAIVDIDEFIMPNNNASSLLHLLSKEIRWVYLIQLIQSITSLVIVYICRFNSMIGAYVFRNVFHYLYWENTTSLIEEHWPAKDRPFGLPLLLTQAKLTRTASPNKNGQRSKYVILPKNVLMIGNHVVWKFLNGKRANHNRAFRARKFKLKVTNQHAPFWQVFLLEFFVSKKRNTSVFCPENICEIRTERQSALCCFFELVTTNVLLICQKYRANFQRNKHFWILFESLCLHFFRLVWLDFCFFCLKRNTLLPLVKWSW